MELSRRIRAFLLFGTLALMVLLFGRTTQANIYDTSIMDTIRADGRFTTYHRALEQTGLDQMLAFNGQFTVLAPTDTAFAKLPPATRDALFADTNTLRQLLLNHMLLSRWETGVLGGWDVANSILGKPLAVRVQAGTLFLGDARIVEGNIAVDNGLIHVVDAVLIPPAGNFNSNVPTQQSGQVAPTVAADSPPVASGTIYEILASDTRFRTLVRATQNAGLTQLLDKNGPFTLLAPTNAAFDALPEGALDALLADKTAIRQVVLLHMMQGRFEADRLETLRNVKTALGQNVQIELRGGNLYIDGARLIVQDIVAENGTIHVIDTVLTP